MVGALADDPNRVKFVYWDNLTYAGTSDGIQDPALPFRAGEPEAWDPAAAATLYSDYLDHCVQAEELGFAGVSLPEHTTPGSIEGYPNIMMAALAMRTKTARIVSGVNIPLWHRPVDMAGEIAMVDVLSKGRLEIGLGRHGSYEDQMHALDLVDGVLHQIDYPVAAEEAPGFMKERLPAGSTAKINLWPRPMQKKIPLWVATGGEMAVRDAARRGMGLMTGLSTNPQAGGMSASTTAGAEESFRHYLDASAEAGTNMSMANVMVVCFTVIADTDKEAGELARKGFINHVTHALRSFKRAGLPMDDAMAGEIQEKIASRSAESFVTSPFSFVGSIETVREKLERLRSIGLTRFMLPFGFGLEHNVAWQSAVSFARDVAPEHFVAESAAKELHAAE